MSNEQKLREAVFIVLEGFTLDYNVRKILEAAYYRPEALATTEPEPTGMPELPEPDEMGDRWLSSHVYTTNQTRAYGEQCWKAGYKHGAWADKPVVNQQLTTEPVDEREAFEKWVTKNGEWPNNALRSCLDPDRYANFDIQGLWGAWQAGVAMAQGVKG